MYEIELNDVKTAIAHLKLGKSDGEEGLNSDHIIQGSVLLQKYLTFVFNAMLSHGLSPDSMLNGTMIPIPKGKGKAIIHVCSDNYRAITLSSILCKVFDWIVLLKENKILRSSDLQFGFKEHASTTQCTFAMNEVISYHNNKGSDVFVVFLDATKAFDRIDFCKLFRKLLDRNMPPLLLRLLLYMHTNKNLQVRWGSIAGTKFGACNRVKQGAVLSPILFAVYMDDLYSQLRDSGSGCHIGNHYVGSLGYADDTVLMAPSLKGLQTIVDVSVNYARKHDVIYNGSKSQFLIFPSNSGSHVKRHISIDGNVLQSINEAVHLGHHVSVINKDCMLQHAISHFWRSFNIFRADFGRLYPEIQCDLFITYCSSFYGAPLWNICSGTFKQLCAAWRKCLRKIWRVHPMTHCDVITLLSHCKPMEIGIQQRFCKFVANIFQNGTPVLRTIVSTALNNPLSVFCSNYNTIIGHGNMNCLEVRANLYKDWLASLSGGLICNANALRELLGMRDGTHVSVLSFDETIYFIDDICLNWDFTSLHHVSLPVIYSLIFDILSQFTSIHCGSMCFYLFIYPSHMLFLSMCFTVPYLLVNYVRIKIYILIDFIDEQSCTIIRIHIPSKFLLCGLAHGEVLPLDEANVSGLHSTLALFYPILLGRVTKL